MAQPIEDEGGFWDKLNGILSSPCASSHEAIDDALRAWLYLVAECRDRLLHSEDDVAGCSQRLVDSAIFQHNKDYVRTQIVYSFLQENDCGLLHVIANFLLLDGRTDETTFRLMVGEGCFVRLLELIRACREHDGRLHRLLLELMYQLSRIERLQRDDLVQVDDSFVLYLFQLIEVPSDDTDDPHHYSIIRVLVLEPSRIPRPLKGASADSCGGEGQLVLNEQYMVASTSGPLTNRVIKMLGVHGPTFRTFGENLILLLNRESETTPQLLILKLLYLLFTTISTCEYFYTNDLRVLLDVIVRNLLDLPDEVMSLRHTYLRVLHPLLAHTQLSHAPHYKRDEILKVLRILSGSGSGHFAPADETTRRLVERVSKVRWLGEEPPPTGTGKVELETSRDSRPEPTTRSEPGSPSFFRDVARPSETMSDVPRQQQQEQHHGALSTNSTDTLARTGQKKLPPKLPPPRRRARRTSTSGSGPESLGGTEPLATLPGSTSVS